MHDLVSGGNVEHLLEELHKKKRWLDTVIAGLESALESPQHRLIEMMTNTFNSEAQQRSPKVDLKAADRSELAQLARLAGGGADRRNQRPRRSAARSSRQPAGRSRIRSGA